MAENSRASLDDLLIDLRRDLREELELEPANERPEHLEASPFAPRCHESAGTVTRRHEAQRLKPRKRRTKRQPVYAKSQRKLAFGGQPRAGP